VRFLLDTHCWLWLQTDPDRFSGEVLGLLEHPANDLFFSAASSWEIAIKYALGKLSLPEPPGRYVPTRMRASGTRGLPVEHAHAARVAELPPHHRDPFERLLVAQAQLEKLTLVTVDPQLEKYDLDLRFAR